jgi:LuxR family transcriptional regulator, maltose regulon positive regulatory protein
LPLAQVQSSLTLRIWMARQQLFHLESAACAASVEAIEADLPANAVSERFTVQVLRAALAIQCDRFGAVIPLLPQLLEAPPTVDSVTLTGRNNVVSWIYMQRGEYQKAREMQSPVPPAAPDASAPLLGTAAGTLMGRAIVGLSYALEGQMNQAERIYRAVLREAERQGRAGNQPACVTAALLSEVLYEQNQNDAARGLLEGRVDALERVGVADVMQRGMLVLSGACWAAGHRLDAFAWLERLEEIGVTLNLPRALGVSLGMQVHRRLALGEVNVAKTCLERLQALDAAAAGEHGWRGAVQWLALCGALSDRAFSDGDGRSRTGRVASRRIDQLVRSTRSPGPCGAAAAAACHGGPATRPHGANACKRAGGAAPWASAGADAQHAGR